MTRSIMARGFEVGGDGGGCFGGHFLAATWILKSAAFFTWKELKSQLDVNNYGDRVAFSELLAMLT